MTEPTARLPSQHYLAGVKRGAWEWDLAQQPALAELDRLHQTLLEPLPKGRLRRMFSRVRPVPPGLYLWGGVGRGKTFLMDLFYEHLPLPRLPGQVLGLTDTPTDHPACARGDSSSGGKYRTHFHRFMQGLHTLLRQHSGERDPLANIVTTWCTHLRVLALDEFFVSDIGDAMLLARLLERMFAERIVLVTTSNTVPAALYLDGLQRARFLPAITLLEQHCHVLHLDSPTDYRLRTLIAAPLFHTPLDAYSETWLAARWTALAGSAEQMPAGTPQNIEIDGRKMAVRARRQGLVWFDFNVLCEGPRSASDYLQIAHEFHTVLLGGIPQMGQEHDDAARRFMTLIDALYDCQVNLVCTAAAPPQQLYTGQRLAFMFARTASRLSEMRSADYLSRAHYL